MNNLLIRMKLVENSQPSHKATKVHLLIIAFAAIIGFTITACISPVDNGDGDDGEKLPTASGVNAVSGKTYYRFAWLGHVTFSTTASGAKNGTYVGRAVDTGTYVPYEKFRYIDTETGTYTWNEEARTVTLKPERVAANNHGYASGGSVNYYIEIEYGQLKDKTGYRSDVQVWFNSYIADIGEAILTRNCHTRAFPV